METAILNVSDGTEMQVHIARPTDTAHIGIIVIQEAFGVTEYIQRTTKRFADK